MAVTTWAKFKTLPKSSKVFLAEVEASLASDPLTTATLAFGTTGKNFSRHYHPCIAAVPRMRKALQEVFRGRSLPSWGKLVLNYSAGHVLTADGAVTMDDLINGTWVMREIALLYGGESLPYSEYQTIFTGIVANVEWGSTEIAIKMKDFQEILAKSVVTPNVIEAGVNVPATSVGKTKPLGLGEVRNASPILIDDVNYTYLFHDTATLDFEDITNVYDDGVPVIFIDNSDGTFDLVSAPVGAITVDFEGAKLGAVPAYSTLWGDMADGLLRAFAGMGAADIDSAYISAVKTDLPYDLGLFVDRKTSVLDVFDELIRGLPVWYTFTRSGVFRTGEFKPPAGSPAHSLTQVEVMDRVSGKYHEPVIYRQQVKYDRNWTVLSSADVDGAVTLAQKEWLTEQWRETEYKDAAILANLPSAIEADPVETCLLAEADAQAVAEKWVDLLGTLRRPHTVTVKPLTLDFELHQEVNLTFPKFGLNAGANFRITELTEHYGDGEAGNAVDLLLWG